MFTAHGKAKCSFPTSCKHSYPQLHEIGSYTLSHNATTPAESISFILYNFWTSCPEVKSPAYLSYTEPF